MAIGLLADHARDEAAAQKTRDYWAANLQVDHAGTRRLLNFWDMDAALAEYRAIAFPADPAARREQPAMSLLRSLVAPGTLDTGISIGCGTAGKELRLVRTGLVRHIVLIDLVPELIAEARRTFTEAGLADRATFVVGDYAEAAPDSFDLVYFDNALHHLAKVDEVIRFCARRLRPGGWFVMDDFVGPTFNQFSEKQYRYADHVRSLLPAGAFAGAGALPERLGRIPVQAYLDSDPSEACDSAAILPAIARHMRGARIVPTGGLVYYLACRSAFQCLRAPADETRSILKLLFELDRALVRANPTSTAYALASWQKPPENTPSSAEAERPWTDLIHWPDWGIPLP